MNILLVDDETYVIDNIRQKIRWEKFAITNIYTANNIRQAMEILKNTRIKIVICDIVMPQGTGFELLEWVREQKMNVQAIFLTSYAEFDYAQQAIRLSSVDYLLKPIDYTKLEQSIEKAIHNDNHREEGEKWKHSKRQIQEAFLKDVVLGSILKKEEIDREMKIRKIEIAQEEKFVSLLLHFYQGINTKQRLERNTLEFVIRNVLNELLEKSEYTVELAVSIEDQMYHVVLREIGEQDGKLMLICDQFLQWMREYLNMDIWCGIGECCSFVDLTEKFKRLRDMREHNLDLWNQVTPLEVLKRNKISYHNPSIPLWKTLLQEKNAESLISSMEEYLDKLSEINCITLEHLKNFRTDFIQLIYTYLAEQQIKAYLLFGMEQSDAFYRHALEGVKGAKEAVHHYVTKALEYTEFAEKPQSVVEIIVKYIDSHYQWEISRNDLAQLVYLNADYLSRIFKKEMGVSISTYLIQKRLEIAKELLTSSNMPINAVSIQVGYSNFSYFTKMFRENTGDSPVEYRRKTKKENIKL